MRLFAALGALVLVACSSSAHQIPQSHVDAPRASLGAAEQQGVASVPAAEKQLARAKSELEAANRAAGQGLTRKADLLYLRADADARLAIVIAQDEGVIADMRRIEGESRAVENEVRRCAQAGGNGEDRGEGKRP